MYKRHVDLLKTQMLALLWSFCERLFVVVLNDINENNDHNVTKTTEGRIQRPCNDYNDNFCWHSVKTTLCSRFE